MQIIFIHPCMTYHHVYKELQPIPRRLLDFHLLRVADVGLPNFQHLDHLFHDIPWYSKSIDKVTFWRLRIEMSNLFVLSSLSGSKTNSPHFQCVPVGPTFFSSCTPAKMVSPDSMSWSHWDDSAAVSWGVGIGWMDI